MSLLSFLYFFLSACIAFFSSSILSKESFLIICSIGVSFAPLSVDVLFLFFVDVPSNKLLYWFAQFFCENHSDGLLSTASHIGFIVRLTDAQFWSPLRTTQQANTSFSLTDQSSIFILPADRKNSLSQRVVTM